MTVLNVEFVEEVDNAPQGDYYGDYDQGTTYNNYRIYKLTNEDGSEQFLKFAVLHDSYGTATTIGELRLSVPQEKTVIVWQ
jgi:hypothetical protein